MGKTDSLGRVELDSKHGRTKIYPLRGIPPRLALQRAHDGREQVFGTVRLRLRAQVQSGTHRHARGLHHMSIACETRDYWIVRPE